MASGDKRVYFVYGGNGQRRQISTWNGSIWTSTVNEYFLWADGKIIQKRVGDTVASTSGTTRTHSYDQGEARHAATGTPTKRAGGMRERESLRTLGLLEQAPTK